MSNSTRREAERIVALSRCGPVNPDGVAAVVVDVLIERCDAALQDRDERAVLIAETLYAHRIFDVDAILRAEIAAAIRKDD